MCGCASVALAHFPDSVRRAAKYTGTVVVTGEHIPTTMGNAVQRIRVLDSTRIRQQQAQSLRDLLLPELAVSIQQDNITGSALSIQGVGRHNVKILVDGVPMTGRVDGTIDLSQLPLYNTERVEIVEGPMNTLYGSDALGGVVNIITRNPVTAKTSAQVHAYTESIGTGNLDCAINTSFENVSLALSGGRNGFSGWSRNNNQIRAADWKPREQWFFDGNVNYNIGEVKARWSSRLFFETLLNRGEPRAPFMETAFDDRFLTTRHQYMLRVEFPIGNANSTVTAGYQEFIRVKESIVKNLVTLQELFPNDQGALDTNQFQTFTLRGTMTKQLTDQLRYEIGTDNIYDRALGDRISGSQQTMADVAGFVSARYQVTSGFALQPAVRVAWNSQYDAPITPSINAKYSPLPNTHIRANYSQGFRTPNLRELFLFFVDVNHNIQGNTSLAAERSDNVQLSVSSVWADTTNALSVDASCFWNDIRNMITLAQVNNTLFSYVNIGEYRTMGATATVKASSGKWQISLGGSIIGRSAFSTRGNTGQVRVSAEAQLIASTSDPILEVQWNVFAKHTGAVPTAIEQPDGSVGQGSMQAYTMADVTATKSIETLNGLSITAAVKNLFNVTAIGATGNTQGAHAGGSTLNIATGRMYTMGLLWAPRW
jgi:outer membrane receptor for ferrienterochelin and colicins